MKKPSGRSWKGERIVLFVEGYSDLVFLAELLESLGFESSEYYIQHLDGRTGVQEIARGLHVFLTPNVLPRVESLVVILDADESAARAFSSARDALRKQLAVDLREPGTWGPIPRTHGRAGVFIMGRQDGTGEIESLVWESLKSAPARGDLADCVESFMQCATAGGFRTNSVDKVRVGVALSALHSNDPRPGPAARAKLIDFQSPAFAPLVEFLKEMRPS